MRPEEILEHVRRRPFQPFRAFVSDGSSYDVRHPEMIFVTRTLVMVGLPDGDERLPARAAWCDPVHITRIELINGQGQKGE